LSAITLLDVARAAGAAGQNHSTTNVGLTAGRKQQVTPLAWPIASSTPCTPPGRQRRQHLRIVPAGFSVVLLRDGADPLVISLLTGVAKPICCRSSPPTAHDHHPRVATVGDGIHPDLGGHQRRGRRGAGACHCPGGIELRVDATEPTMTSRKIWHG